MTGQLRVVATAGHVDHGKSSLILNLTGIDPDRWEEEKRRGLTIDLGYAWCTLPSGREIGFVDVPGHERFIGNMLVGVGPVRLVMFVVAADEGWKPQSEEHLQILELLGIAGGVIALTKRDLVDAGALGIATQDIRAKVTGTALEQAPIVAVSSVTGQGVEELREALDRMVGGAEAPPDTRTRLFVDRVFTIKGAGTVVTGTLGGGCITVGDEVELYPTGLRARVRSLQTHKTKQERACPVGRVAANLVGAERGDLQRGDVLGVPGAWRPTREFDAVLRPVRGSAHPVTSRGAFKLYAGAGEADVTLRFLGATKLEPGGEAFARIRSSRPMVLDVFDRFVLREAGRRETVAGGEVLDVAPPARARAVKGADPHLRLQARAAAARDDLPRLLASERGAVRTEEALLLTGSTAPAPLRVGEWFVREDLVDAVERAVTETLAAHHLQHPLEEGADLASVRATVSMVLRRISASADPQLIEVLLEDLTDRGVVARTASAMHLPSHAVVLDRRSAGLEGLLAAIGGTGEATPPTVTELQAAGSGREVIEAAARAGIIVRVTPELVFTPEFVARAEALVRASGAEGITVSAFREHLGTSRKYAIPLLEWFDQSGVTRREGDLRFAREPDP